MLAPTPIKQSFKVDSSIKPADIGEWACPLTQETHQDTEV